ncbi:MAG: hypothetical protein RLO52_41760 [Sandaracinaceae bacterium]
MHRPAWLAMVLLVAAPARAQEMNRQAFPVGEEAVGMAGAYTGRADDASAAYYNPGGLPVGHRGNVGVSLSVSILDEYRLGAFDPSSTALEYRDALGVPFYAGGSVQVDGSVVRHGFAFATFSPNNVNRRFTAASQEGGETRSVQIHRVDRTRWYGVSYGLSPIPELGIGVSAFLAVRSFRHEEEEIVTEGARSLFTRFAQVDLGAELLVFRIGALWQIDPTFSLGLMVQPPGAVLGGRATVSGTAAGTMDGGPIDTRFFSDEIGADSPLPFQARLGASWRPSDSFMLNADAILEGPLGSASAPIERLRVDPDDPAILGRFLATRYHADWVGDLAIGGRGVIEGLVPISAGVFTSFSAAPPIEGAPTSYRPDRIHVIGATLGVGVITDDVDFTIGVVGAFGFGRGLTTAPFSDLGAPTYGVADVSSQTLFLYFVGAGSAAAAVGRQVAEELLGREDEPVDDDAPSSVDE